MSLIEAPIGELVTEKVSVTKAENYRPPAPLRGARDEEPDILATDLCAIAFPLLKIKHRAMSCGKAIEGRANFS